MASVLVIGGTRYIGQHAVEAFLDAGDDVTVFNEGDGGGFFADDDRVDHVQGDRTDTGALEAAAMTVEPDVVIDVVAYHPRDVRTATSIFEGVDAYVFVSSSGVYADAVVPKREDETPLLPCTEAQAVDDSMATYGNRKAECDRAVFEAAADGVRAMVLRPPYVYGPRDYSGRLDYWIDRVATHDRILVPGDGGSLSHSAFVEDVASALVSLVEAGEPGEAYNCASRTVPTLDDWIDLLATALDAEVEVTHASERELSTAGLSVGDFPLYVAYPQVLSTGKLAGLGWDSTPLPESVARTVEEFLGSDRAGGERGPARADEERVLDVLGTVG